MSRTFPSLPLTSNPGLAFACPCVLTLSVLPYSKKHSAETDELRCLEAKHTADCFARSPALMAATSKCLDAEAPKGKVCS